MTQDPITLYRSMLLIRECEAQLTDLFAKNLFPGYIHSYLGQEACAVGVCSGLNDSDYIVSNHRGRGHYLAKGMALKPMMAEMLDKATGICGGRGGEMHAADPALGILGGNGIVGAGMPIGAGAALAAKMDGLGAVLVGFFGEGASNNGAFGETLNVVGAVIGGLYETRAEALAAVEPGAAPVEAVAAVVARVDAPVVVAGGQRKWVSPLARRIAKGAGVDAAGLTGTGAHGALMRRDVDQVIQQQAEVPAQVPALVQATGPGPLRRPLAGLRKTIARNMMQSLQMSAQMTAFARVDMAEVVALRASCVANERALGVRVTFTDIVLKACAIVLARMPDINASIIGDEIVTWDHVNIGLAVSLDDGLIVPVIKDADRKSLIEIAHERIDLAARARAGRLGQQDATGGTFTLSNFGSYGGDFETPLLNPPQSAILGIGAITDEVVVRDGQIVIRPMMMLSMTFDHRLIDGAVAGRFRSELRALLEKPATMLAGMR
jgi:pyruvate dehydrogenase E2 component (dihydrolipoamide acetyltransferase)